MTFRLLALFFISFLVVGNFCVAGELALADLIKPMAVKQVKISPDGDKLAVVTLREGKRVLALMTLEPLKTTFLVHFQGKKEVGNFHWANNERIVTSVWERTGWLDSPGLSSTLYAIDYDGRNSKTVFGYAWNYNSNKNSRIKKQESHEAHAWVISTLPNDDKHILVSTSPWRWRGYQSRPISGDVLKLNVNNGRTKKLMSLPSREGLAYADDDGVVHFASGIDSEGYVEFYRRKDDKWVRLGDLKRDNFSYPSGYSEDGKTAYIVGDNGEDKMKLLSLDLETDVVTEMYAHPRVSITHVTNYPGTSEPMVVHTDDGKPEEYFLDKTHKTTRYLRGIHKAFDGYRVGVASVTTDGKVAIVTVDGDNMPTDFFLVNFETKAAEMLMSSAGWLDPPALANTEVFELTARDGLHLQGYLTFPHSGRENLPMVVLPHGGPSARDYWQYDDVAQILANQGFLVLTVNFRGSTGYGSAFYELSEDNWGSLVQNDIADATRWAMSQGYANPKKACIYGFGFGAYSALMGVIREPDLYQCAAGFAGVYDLEMMYEEGDIPQSRRGVGYLKDEIGEDAGILQKFSPIHNVGKIKVPVYLAHGEEDDFSPIEHAYALEKALQVADVETETQYYKKGGHGYYTEAANMELYTGLVTFLNKHIGEK